MNVHRMSYYIPSVDDKTVPMWVQLYWLLRRELITDKRNPWPMYIDLGSHIVMGFITGISYYNIGKTYNPRDVSVRSLCCSSFQTMLYFHFGLSHHDYYT